jgi:hypothetical protein
MKQYPLLVLLMVLLSSTSSLTPLDHDITCLEEHCLEQLHNCETERPSFSQKTCKEIVRQCAVEIPDPDATFKWMACLTDDHNPFAEAIDACAYTFHCSMDTFVEG